MSIDAFSDKIKFKAEKVPDWVFYLICSVIIGSGVFVAIYGIAPLNVTNDQWLLCGEDLNQHYLGWKFYRNSQYHFPVGLIDGLTVEPISVIYTDSIPLLAVIFKLVSFMLPDTFQYFGIWGISCYILQTFFAMILLSSFSKNKLQVVMGSLLFTFSPVLLKRMFAHSALAANWVILAALAVWAKKQYFSGLKRKSTIWSALMVLAVSVHMYLMPMVLAIMCACTLNQLLESIKNKSIWLNVREALVTLIVPLVSTLFVMYVLGAFYGSPGITQTGVMDYCANLNAFYNPMGTSEILPDFPVLSENQYEGYAYLGLGVLGALAVGVTGGVCLRKWKAVKRLNKSSMISLGVIVFILSLYAFGPRVSWNDIVLGDIPWPESILKLFSIFRVTGRYIWPVMYIFYTLAVVLVMKVFQRRLANILLGLIVVVQVIDITSVVRLACVRTDMYAPGVIQDASWDELGDDFNHVEFITSFDKEGNPETLLTAFFPMKTVFDIADFACDHRMSLNDFYIGRRNGRYIEQLKYKHWLELQQGRVDPETIYIFNRIPFNLTQNDALKLYEIDGLIIGITSDFTWDNEPESRIRKSDPINVIQTDAFLTNGEDKEGRRILHEGGISFGPYIPLGQGRYHVCIKGENLDNVSWDVSSGSRGMTFTILNEKKNSEEIVFEVELKETFYDMEFRIFNTQPEDVIIDSFIVQLIE